MHLVTLEIPRTIFFSRKDPRSQKHEILDLQSYPSHTREVPWDNLLSSPFAGGKFTSKASFGGTASKIGRYLHEKMPSCLSLMVPPIFAVHCLLDTGQGYFKFHPTLWDTEAGFTQLTGFTVTDLSLSQLWNNHLSQKLNDKLTQNHSINPSCLIGTCRFFVVPLKLTRCTESRLGPALFVRVEFMDLMGVIPWNFWYFGPRLSIVTKIGNVLYSPTSTNHCRKRSWEYEKCSKMDKLITLSLITFQDGPCLLKETLRNESWTHWLYNKTHMYMYTACAISHLWSWTCDAPWSHHFFMLYAAVLVDSPR